VAPVDKMSLKKLQAIWQP